MAQHSEAEIRESRIQSQDRLQRKILSQREKREAGKMAQWVKKPASKSDSMSPYNSSERTWGPVTSFLTSKWACGVCATSQIHYTWNRCEKEQWNLDPQRQQRCSTPYWGETHVQSQRKPRRKWNLSMPWSQALGSCYGSPDRLTPSLHWSTCLCFRRGTASTCTWRQDTRNFN